MVFRAGELSEAMEGLEELKKYLVDNNTPVNKIRVMIAPSALHDRLTFEFYVPVPVNHPS